ncbi:MAG TPA: metallopeptidase TldD-related protein [Bryobacteraceae bacterium]|jgi:PmbA protein|nr:metallopeptidase TldD-related protein [Bryobacteraceae bacterium]
MRRPAAHGRRIETRKLGLRTSCDASRGLAGNAGVGNGNLYIKRGGATLEELIAGIREVLAFAVSEVTIAGTLQQMLMSIDGIGADLEFRGSMAAPTLVVGEMTVGGR